MDTAHVVARLEGEGLGVLAGDPLLLDDNKESADGLEELLRQNVILDEVEYVSSYPL